MNSEEQLKLLNAKEKLDDQDNHPSHDQSSMHQLKQAISPDILADDEVEDNTDYYWDDFDEFQIKTDAMDIPRDITEIPKINKMIRFYTKYLFVDKKPISEKEELEGLAKIMKHQKLFAEGKFTWEIALPDMDAILGMVKTTISKFSSPFDIEMIDHSLFQKLFPLKIIDQYLSVVNRQYGKPVYDKALRFHTNLIEIFLWHHFNADTRFHPKITTSDINVIDPFLRNQIREKNRNDLHLKDKYFNPSFDLKQFTYRLLDLYFPNVTWRYIGGGQEMHRWTLLLLLEIFEMGFFKAEEMQELVNLLLQKLENLLVLEKRSYQDFKTSLINYPSFNKSLKAYFYECKQIVAAICIQIAMLLNDQSFLESFPLFNKELSIGENPKNELVWKRAYFSNANVGTILNRIMTTYLFQLTEPLKPNEREKMFNLLNDFTMLTMDIENDVCYVSSKVVNESLIEYYYWTPMDSDLAQADATAKELENLLDQLCFLNLNKKKEFTERVVLTGLKKFLVELAQRTDETARNYFKNLLGLRGVPNILLALICALEHFEVKRELEVVCGLALTEVCKGSLINQVFATNEIAMAHWKIIFEKQKLTGVMLLTSIFGGNYHLFYVHRSMMKKFLFDFKKLAEEGLGKFTNLQEWLTSMKEAVVDQKIDHQLDSIVMFYLYCRFLCDLVTNKDMNYESKFHNLEIQELLVKPFFNLFYPIILDENFLTFVEECVPADQEGKGAAKPPRKYTFKARFRNSSTVDLNEFLEQNSTGGINESELRCAVFEVAMLTMKLLNKACTGLYPNWIYNYHVKPTLPDLLQKTRYVLDLPESSAEYRTIILNFYTNFKVFATNSLMTNRIAEFKDHIVVNKEARVPMSHKDGTLITEIIEELQQAKKIEQIWDERPHERSQILEYYYHGILSMLYKLFKGIYSSYSFDDKLDKFVESLEKLKDEIIKLSPILTSKFDIGFDLDETNQELGGLAGGLLGGLNKIVPVGLAAQSEKVFTRIKDKDEFLYPRLSDLRDLCETFLGAIDITIQTLDARNSPHLQEFTDSRFNRHSAIYCSKINLEPWSYAGSTSGGVTFSTSKIKESEVSSSMNLAKMLLAGTGLISSELRHFYALMDIYQEEKFLHLNKPIDENIFLKFLESGKEYAPKLITFICRLVDRFYNELLMLGQDGSPPVPAEDSKEAAINIDFVLKTFLQNDIIYSIVAFFSKVIADCESIREALYEKVSNDKDEENVGAKNMLSILYLNAILLHPIVINKTFMDFEFQIISEKYSCLTAMFKNICENNNQKFKNFFGTYAPTLKAVPSFNKPNKPLVYDAYIKLEHGYLSFNSCSNKDEMLRVDDKAEILPYISSWMKMITEMVNGPCLISQKQIYIFKTDSYSGAIKRMVDNVESTYYHHKNVVTDYIDGLLEGNNPDIVKHFASNFTFDILFDLICDSIKRIYIYSMVHGNKAKYAKLVKKAMILKAKKTEEQLKHEQSYKKLIDKQMEFYNQAPQDESTVNKVKSIVVKTKSDSSKTVAEEFLDPRIISQEILDYVKIDDYNDIMDLYLSSNEFSKHVILATVFKLNDFLYRFSTIVAGYKICLENVFSQLIDIYGDEVPIYIINMLGNYEPKENREKSEKLVIYMFLCKITSEIELLNPSTKNLVKVYFPLIPKIFFLTKITKDDLLQSADTSAMTMDLIINYELLEIEMNYNINLFRKTPLLYRLTSDNTFYYVKFVLWVLAAILNIVLIAFYRRDAYHSWIDGNGTYALIAIASLIIIISFLSIVVWFIARYPQKVLLAIAKMTDSKTISESKLAKFYRLYIKETILKQVYPVLFSFYIICSFLGIFIQPFFFSLMLLMIVSLSTTMNYVVKAITTHADQLIQTVVLMVMVIYCYAVLSAEYFFDKLSSNQPQERFYNCTHLWECLTYVFNNGLRYGGGIGDATVSVNPTTSLGTYMGKFFFDVGFFFLINVISLNIIFGIIIDTFADMRQKNEDKGRPSLLQRKLWLRSAWFVFARKPRFSRKDSASGNTSTTTTTSGSTPTIWPT
jgi:hypothetical protein